MNARIDPNTPMTSFVVNTRILASHPFTLVDVGCWGGFDARWRIFADQLAGFGFDLKKSEVDRLNQVEQNPRVEFLHYRIGLPEEDPFVQAREAFKGSARKKYFDTFYRSSFTTGFEVLTEMRKKKPGALEAAAQEVPPPVPTETISLTEFASRHHVRNLDFIKTDTDGFDLEVLISGEALIRSHDILGFQVEVFFNLADYETENNFLNVDRYLRGHGFQLYDISVNRYSRKQLPARFLEQGPASTAGGQVQWGDLVYLRDAASEQYQEIWGAPLSAINLIKLACIYELFHLPDCAAELILVHRDRLHPLVDTNKLLDLLALSQPVEGRRLPYQDYMKLFHEDLDKFFDPRHRPLVK